MIMVLKRRDIITQINLTWIAELLPKPRSGASESRLPVRVNGSAIYSLAPREAFASLFLFFVRKWSLLADAQFARESSPVRVNGFAKEILFMIIVAFLAVSIAVDLMIKTVFKMECIRRIEIIAVNLTFAASIMFFV